MGTYILPGCRSKPMASYLKAIGIMRLIAEQGKDPDVKGSWEGEHFRIHTALEKDALVEFFCHEYSPTPIVAPWNGGSGFHQGDSTDGIDAILRAESSRFIAYQDVIKTIFSWPEIKRFEKVGDVQRVLRDKLDKMRPGDKKDGIERLLRGIDSGAPSPKVLDGANFSDLSLDEIESRAKAKKSEHYQDWGDWWKTLKAAVTKAKEIRRTENKGSILPSCRARLPENVLLWLDAVCAFQLDGKASFNPVLGTGGNEGRLEFSNQFMQCLSDLFIKGDPQQTKSLFMGAVFDEVVTGLSAKKIGQFDPGRAGGYNQGMDIETKDFKINPWDFILALEGTLLLAGAIVRRNPTEERAFYTAPFTVSFSPVGFSSSAYEETGAYETWLPLWQKPATCPEIRYLFGEGRSAIGRRVARSGLDFSRAVSTLGVDRGIQAFERYAFLQRRGKSKVALPAGRVPVQYKPSVIALNEFDPIADQVSRFLREFKNVPADLIRIRSRIDNSLFACSQQADVFTFQNLVRDIGNLEKFIAFRDRSKKPTLERPLFGLSPRWIELCDDGSPEVRVAAAIASIGSTDKVGPIRSYIGGVHPGSAYRWNDRNNGTYWYGSHLLERLAGVLLRRLLDAERTSASRMPLEARLPISPFDVMPLVRSECDETKIEELMWGFTLVDWRAKGVFALRRKWAEPFSVEPLSRVWCLLKLLHSPEKVRGVNLRKETRIAHLLKSGRVNHACEVAIRRLRTSELHPCEVVYEEYLDGIRLLGSLLIPTTDQYKLEALVLEKKTD